jgi:hypothetical protein
MSVTFKNIAFSVDQQCCICFENFKKNENVIGHIFNERIGGSHSFHSNCINEWFKTQRKCPICKIPVLNPVFPPLPPVDIRLDILRAIRLNSFFF